MTNIDEKLNNLLDQVVSTKLEGIPLKIFISKKVMESIKILVEYFGMFIEKKKPKNNNKFKIRSSSTNNNNNINNNYDVYRLTKDKLDELLKKISDNNSNMSTLRSKL